MTNRIFKDIRYYETGVPNAEGNSKSDNLGALFKPTSDTTYIGQRIARKLNELGFCYGEVDHIYINLCNHLPENSLAISNKNLEKWYRYIDIGLSISKFNALSDTEKDQLIESITFRVLKYICLAANLSLNLVNEVELLIAKLGTEIQIAYKMKETNKYKINISYQINPGSSSTRAIVKYFDKKDNSTRQGFIPIQFYDDIYYLVDTIIVKGDDIILNPKKSYRAEFNNKRYKIPIVLKIIRAK